jgi:tetratricopeptide (TPR) repeat protein
MLQTRCCFLSALLLWLSLCAPLSLSAQTPPAPKPTPEVQALLDVGKKEMSASHWEEALRQLTAALEKARAVGDKDGEARALGNLGKVYYYTGQPQKALEYYQQALSIFQAVGDRTSEAVTLFNLGSVYSSTGQPQKALDYLQQALPIYRAVGDKNGEADTLTNIGIVYRNTGQLQKALEYYQQALPLFRQGGDKNMEAGTLTDIGIVYADIGQPQKALDYLQQALPMHRQNGNRQFEATTLYGLGRVYADTGQPQKALDYYQQALSIERAVGDRKGEAVTLGNIGIVYRNTGQPKKALDYLQQALSIFQAVGDRKGEAGTLFNLGLGYANMGQSQKELDYYQQALPLWRQVGDMSGEADTLNNIGNFYRGTGQLQKALEYYQQALPLERAVRDRSGEAAALNNIGLVYWSTGQPQKALECYQQVLSIRRAVRDRNGEASTLMNIGLVYSDTGQPQKALDYYQQVLSIRRAVGDKNGDAGTLNNIGLVYFDTGQPQKALEFYQQALPIVRAVGDWQGEAQVLYNTARAERTLRRLADAQTHFAQSVALIERRRESLGGLSEAKQSFLASYLSFYDTYLSLLLERHQTIEAFDLAQKTKARSLLDLMASGKVELTGSLAPEEQQKEQQFRQNADQLNAALLQQSMQKRPDPKQLQTLRQELVKAESALQTYQDTLYARHPDLAQKRAARTLTLAEVPTFLPADTALLEYLVLQAGNGKEALDETVLLVVTLEQGKPRLQVYSLSLPTAQLTALADAFRHACATRDAAFKTPARLLYARLVAPAAKQLSGKKRLLVCPDGPLWGLPFQALLVPAPAPHARLAREGSASSGRTDLFLLERYEITYAYSASGAQAALTAQHGHPRGTVLAFANPDFGSETRFATQPPFLLPRPTGTPSAQVAPLAPADAEVLTQRGGITPLPGTEREAQAIQYDFPDAAIYTGKLAQEATVKAEAGRYRYLHLATHGFLNDAAPLLSCILLAQPPPGSSEDGFLTAREIFDLHLNAQMVVLSACNTAGGKKRRGEGIVGLTWALFAAGCPTQVLSQWSVNDASTGVLMGRFYAGVAKGMTKGAALREAALSLLHGGSGSGAVGSASLPAPYAHPFYWAPFVLVGDWR